MDILLRAGYAVRMIPHRPYFPHIAGGVEREDGGNAVQRAFSQVLDGFGSATPPIIRHIAGGVDEKSLRGAFGRCGRGACKTEGSTEEEGRCEREELERNFWTVWKMAWKEFGMDEGAEGILSGGCYSKGCEERWAAGNEIPALTVRVASRLL